MVPLAEYSRDCLRALRQSTGIAYDERSQGTLQLFRTQKQVDGTGGDIEVLKQFGVPFELLDPGRLHRCRTGARPRCAKRSKAGCGFRATRPATARCSPSGWPRSAWSAASPSASDTDEQQRSSASAERRSPAIKITSKGEAGRCLCHGAGQLFGAMDAQAPGPHPGLSGQGLFDHAADDERRRRPGFDRHGRDLQGRHNPARRPHPGRRNGGDFRLRPDAARIAARHAGAFGRRPVSGGAAI